MDKPLTVVLPMRNRERELRSEVLDILELGHATRATIEVIIVDDGSVDETYETACEVARTYPQVCVFRQTIRQGLAAALDLVRHRTTAEMVVVHDGVSVVDTAQLKSLLEIDPIDVTDVRSEIRTSATVDSCGSRRFAPIRELHNSMEQAHRYVLGFCWMQLEDRLIPRRCPNNVESAPMESGFRSEVTESLPSIPMG